LDLVLAADVENMLSHHLDVHQRSLLVTVIRSAIVLQVPTSASSPDHRGATFAGFRRPRPGVTVSFCSIRNLTRSRVTRWHVRAHSCLVMWVARSQSLRHDASHSAPRARTSSSADFGGLVGAAAAFPSAADGGGLVGAIAAFASLADFGGLVGAFAAFAGGGTVDRVVLSVGAACSHWAYATP
jgi:hypothetical protein